MGGKRYCNEAQAAATSSRPQKKVHHEPRNTRSHDSYTVAWICALSIEMSAARAMLDEVHEGLAQDAKDINCYELRRIGKHNVAIACLPNGKYGTNNAATVFTNMTQTFKNIQLGLMVGIRGRAPSKVDLRLGDIVVASEVIQHDIGKSIGDGLFQRTPIHWRVHNSIGTVMSSLQSKHACGSSRVPSILQEMSEKFEAFKRPVTADRLFIATYQHESSRPDCVGCNQSKLIQRGLRDSNDPVIHYGAIASVLCFEMEAAGLMEICLCLSVRGICDYSDSHKTKEWQSFAAVTAATYAREFLEELPVCKDLSRQPSGAFRLEEKDNKCLRDLHITNPQDNKETIIKAKGGLLIESYIWVMKNENY
ncbi:vegetatible incompatibility HET-E-1 [Fusarium acutatum]|uniref:Vegetatible incompatibility HET-E-1 n=1 Tax=Fusarium acutatum TaxID=78861 RepID=A0A8H4NC50_9HYPO|nr:vegetatible incompatibility HET-E-1 [Fusarium acutatum]